MSRVNQRIEAEVGQYYPLIPEGRIVLPKNLLDNDALKTNSVGEPIVYTRRFRFEGVNGEIWLGFDDACINSLIDDEESFTPETTPLGTPQLVIKYEKGKPYVAEAPLSLEPTFTLRTHKAADRLAYFGGLEVSYGGIPFYFPFMNRGWMIETPLEESHDEIRENRFYRPHGWEGVLSNGILHVPPYVPSGSSKLDQLRFRFVGKDIIDDLPVHPIIMKA